MKKNLERIGVAALAIVVAVIIKVQLSTDASPADAFCAVAERQGLVCKVGPTHYGSRVVQTDDGAGTTHTLLVVDDGKTVITIITLQ